MTSNSLWTDEIYTIDHFSSKGPLVTLTDYHAANNHIFFNFVNSVIPGSDSYDPLRARALSICAIFFCIITTVYFYFRRKWYFAGALVLFSLTNSWTHMDLMLQARGYGVVVLCGVALVYFTYSYINEENWLGLLGCFLASIIGTWTIPTFGFFSLSLTGLILLIMRRKKLLWGVLLSYLAVALLYVPLLPAMMRINSGYTGKWGAEFGSFGAVSTTIRNYLLPGASDVIILLLCVVTISVIIVPWKRLGYENIVYPLRFVSAAICVFFTICLLLKTPAIRTAAFVVVPIAIVSISVAYIILSGFLIGRYAKIIVFSISTVLIYQNIAVKNKTLDRYYVPHENWLETASVISHLFPPERVSIYNHHGTSNLLKYLPKDYELDNSFLENKFIMGQQVIVNSQSREDTKLE